VIALPPIQFDRTTGVLEGVFWLNRINVLNANAARRAQ
jgi:hypothetical protein